MGFKFITWTVFLFRELLNALGMEDQMESTLSTMLKLLGTAQST